MRKRASMAAALPVWLKAGASPLLVYDNARNRSVLLADDQQATVAEYFCSPMELLPEILLRARVGSPCLDPRRKGLRAPDVRFSVLS